VHVGVPKDLENPEFAKDMLGVSAGGH
jgi:hypothetical protein